MSNWLMIDMVDFTTDQLATARPDFTAFVERNVTQIEGMAPDRREGFTLLARGSMVESEFGSARSVDIAVCAGADWNNDSSFQIGSLRSFPDPALVTYPIYRGALEAMVSSFPCPYAWAKYFIAEELEPLRPATFPVQPSPPGKRLQPFDGAWIAYLSAPLAAGFTPPADLFPERTPGGGLILSAVKDHIDPTNPDHVLASQKLQTILSERAGKASQRGDIHPGRFPPRVGPC